MLNYMFINEKNMYNFFFAAKKKGIIMKHKDYMKKRVKLISW